MIKSYKILLTSFSAAILLLGMSAQSYAEDKFMDILPPSTQLQSDSSPYIDSSEGNGQSIIRLTPDKSELIKLDKEIGSILIGNQSHINVIADSSKTLVVVPRTPGATHFSVLSKDGEILLQRHVIVASPTKDYLRIKRTCSGDNDSCEKTSVFYCPDSCHEIGLKDQGPTRVKDNTPKQK